MTDILTAVEAAAELRVSKKAVYRLLSAGKLKSVRVGKKYLIPRALLLDFLNVSCYNEPNVTWASVVCKEET